MTNKRYVLTVDLYIYEDSDEKAIETAKAYIGKLKEKEDNEASIVSLHEQNWGTNKNRKIQDYGHEGK